MVGDVIAPSIENLEVYVQAPDSHDFLRTPEGEIWTRQFRFTGR